MTSITKDCVTCGQTKPLDAYPLHKTGRYGRNSVCIECRRAYQRRRYQEHREERLTYFRERRKETAYAAQRQWNEANLARMAPARRARSRVREAVLKGALVRPSACQQCGRPVRVEAAHEDYSRPLDVRWLCRTCHVRWDHADPKTTKGAA